MKKLLLMLSLIAIVSASFSAFANDLEEDSVSTISSQGDDYDDDSSMDEPVSDSSEEVSTEESEEEMSESEDY